MMRIGIRADVNETVATGHIMRCLTIAEEIRRAGAEVVFFSADEEAADYVKEHGFAVVCLHSDWHSLGNELPQLLERLYEMEISQLLVDSYYVTPRYFTALQNNGVRVLYIDDLKAFPYLVNTIVNYSPAASSLGYGQEYMGTVTRLLLGERFVPLRAQFRETEAGFADAERERKTVTKTVEQAREDQTIFKNTDSGSGDIFSVFLTSGGSDPLGINSSLVQAIGQDSVLGDSKIHILAGRFYTADAIVEQAIAEGRAVLHQNVTNVAEIMCCCDAGVTPAGTTLFELASLGIPAVSFLFADNQQFDADWFDREGLIPYAGDWRENSGAVTRSILAELKRLKAIGPEEKAGISRKLSSRIDGHGAERIARAVLEL